MAKVPISQKAFERWFKRTITKPIVARISSAISTKRADVNNEREMILEEDALERIHKELPSDLYAMITSQEANHAMSGPQKYVNVINGLAGWLMARGWGFAVPLFIPTVESSVRRLYKMSNLEGIFDRLKIEDNVEAWLGFKISTNDDADDEKGDDVPLSSPSKATASASTTTKTPDKT